MEAVHRAKLLLLLADFSGVKSSLPAIVARYKVTCFLSSPCPLFFIFGLFFTSAQFEQALSKMAKLILGPLLTLAMGEHTLLHLQALFKISQKSLTFLVAGCGSPAGCQNSVTSFFSCDIL